MPWSLAKDESKKERLETVLFNLLDTIRICAILLQPFMPDTSSEILRQLNVKDNSFASIDEDISYSVSTPTVLFARIDVSK